VSHSNSPSSHATQSQHKHLHSFTFHRRLITPLITGGIARSAKHRYISYAEDDFEAFRPAGATCCTEGGEIWPIYMTRNMFYLYCNGFTALQFIIRSTFSQMRNCCLLLKSYNKSSAVAEMGDRGHNRHGRKEGRGCCAPFADSWDHVYYNVACAEVYFRTKWRVHPSSHLATIDMGQNLGAGGVPFFLEVARSPSNTNSLEERPTSIPSGILVYPAFDHNGQWPKIDNRKKTW